VSADRVDHTAIAVRDLDEALARFEPLLGVTAGERVLIPDQGVVAVFLRLGDTQIELIQPVDGGSGVARFLDRRGEGLHHVAFEVDDLKAELARLEESGVELIDREPRRGSHGQVAFLHPRPTGVLIELVEHDH
jgi:methylmalonyl-CoA/ethylmalonyl-CoA epimerase